MPETSYDVVVVGAGGMGSAAAYHLAKDGRRTLLLEQFHVGHTNGSSHGGSRIIRHAHQRADYASLIPPTFGLWQRLEQESGEHLLKMTGGLDFGPRENADVIQRRQVMEELGFPYRLLEGDELRRAFPQFRIPDGWVAIHHEGAGILSATRCVETMAAQATAHGAVLKEQSRVIRVQGVADGVEVVADTPAGRERFQAGQVVIAAGPWAGRFLSQLGIDLPLRVTHQQVAYFRVEESAQERYQADRCPVFIRLVTPHYYGFPMHEKPGHIKVALELEGEAVDPDTHPRVPDAQALDALSNIVRAHMVGVDPTPASAEACLYTVSPDTNLIIDRHPEHPQILLAAGFSGRGFKFTVAVGRLLADLANLPPNSYDSPLWRELFSLRRFGPDGAGVTH